MSDLTWAALDGVVLSSFASALPKLWPHGDSKVPGLIAGTISAAPRVFAKYDALHPRSDCGHATQSAADRRPCYGGRMGNAPPPSDDGWNFRGQGFSQLTGKANYEALAKACGLDVISNPGLLVQPATALECGVADFIMCGCLRYALVDNLVGVSSMLNIGHYVSNPTTPSTSTARCRRRMCR
jgi:putative chitinase